MIPVGDRAIGQIALDGKRVDIFEKEDGGEIELPVLGIFEFEGDKIAKWREYFDLNQFMSQMG